MSVLWRALLKVELDDSLTWHSTEEGCWPAAGAQMMQFYSIITLGMSIAQTIEEKGERLWFCITQTFFSRLDIEYI